LPVFKSEKIKQAEATAVSARKRLPNRRQSETLDFKHGGHRFTLSLSRFPGKSMTTHRIDLHVPEKGHGKTLYLGQPIGASDSPIFAAARWLLANGLASPDDPVAAYRIERSRVMAKPSACPGRPANWPSGR
jgi:hypothetical protein